MNIEGHGQSLLLKEFRTNLAVALCGIPHQQERRRRPSIDEVPNK